MKKIAYVASQVSVFYEIHKNDANLPRNERESSELSANVRKNATDLCLEALKRGFIPLSTPKIFDCVYDEVKEREIALQDCLTLLQRCDVFLYSKSQQLKSKGITLELEEAKRLNLEIVELP